jgi:chromosome segregation ATPase
MTTITLINKELKELGSQIYAYEEEIEYLESLLVITSGEAQNVIDDLNTAKEELKQIRSEYSTHMKQLEELRE